MVGGSVGNVDVCIVGRFVQRIELVVIGKREGLEGEVMCVRVEKDEAVFVCFFFFQAEDGIRDGRVTGVQTCALPIFFILPQGQVAPSISDNLCRVVGAAGQ